VRACLNPSVKATIEARCKAANLHKQRYYEKMKDPWLHQSVREATFEEANFVRVSHLRLCLDEVNVDPSDRLTAIKLFNVPLPADYQSMVERHGIDTGRVLRHEAAEVKDR
jgi:hypothetical protein